MKLSANQILTYVLLALLVVVVVIILILAAIQIEDEHEFIKDVRKIKAEDGSEILDATCLAQHDCAPYKGKVKQYAEILKHSFDTIDTTPIVKDLSAIQSDFENNINPNKDIGLLEVDISAQLSKLITPLTNLGYALGCSNKNPIEMGFEEILRYSGSGAKKGNIDHACSTLKVPKKEIDSFKTRLSFSKLEARQIYDNNNLIVDNVYNNKESKKCFKAFIDLIVLLGKKFPANSPGKTPFHDSFTNQLRYFKTCYSDLVTNDLQRSKYVVMLIESLFNTAVVQLLIS